MLQKTQSLYYFDQDFKIQFWFFSPGGHEYKSDVQVPTGEQK